MSKSPPAEIAGLYRYPVKGLTPEPLKKVALEVGRTLAIGEARLRIVKNITRCAATNVDPDTAARDLEIPEALMRRFGHNECGIYGEVISDGTIAIGDTITVHD